MSSKPCLSTKNVGCSSETDCFPGGIRPRSSHVLGHGSRSSTLPCQSKLVQSHDLHPSPRTQRAKTVAVEDVTRIKSSKCDNSTEVLESDSYGGLDYSFVEEVPEELVCSVCARVFREPHLTDCCGHHYCNSCLQHWITSGTSDTCPFCRSHDFNHIHDKNLDRRISELNIKCTNNDQGCEWEGHIADHKRHLNIESNSVKGCPFVVCKCENKCGKDVLRKDLQVHLQATCPLRKVQCEDCKASFTYEDIVKQHFTMCEEKNIPCNNCGEVIKRKEMKKHLEEACPNQVMQCPFVDVGCSQSVVRKDYDQHFAMCKKMHLMKLVMKMKEQLLSQSKELATIKEENQFLRKQIVHLRRGVLVSHNNLDILHRRSNTLRNVVSNELQYLHMSDHPSEILALKCIKTKVDASPIHLQSGGKSATFRMSDYSTYKKEGQVWYTPSFHVANGYALCFGVDLNGVGAGKGTHVSLYLYQLAGVFDGRLKWPYYLEENFEVCIIRQTERSQSIERSTLGRMFSPQKAKHVPDQTENQIVTEQLPNNAKGAELELSVLRSKAFHPSVSMKSDKFTAEGQVLCVAQYLSEPVESSSVIGVPVSELELFCLQKTVEEMVYRDSLVFHCRLHPRQDTMTSPVEGVAKGGWEVWSGRGDD